jgi:hypothetical protein
VTYLEMALGIMARRQPLGTELSKPNSESPDDTIPNPDLKKHSVREQMEDSLRQFGHPHAQLFPLIGKRVWTSQGTGKLLSVFATRCEVHPEGTHKTIRVRPEEVRLIQ